MEEFQDLSINNSPQAVTKDVLIYYIIGKAMGVTEIPVYD